jgi:hypothetical protein
MTRRSAGTAGLLLAIGLAGAACTPRPAAPARVNPEAAALKEFVDRAEKYAELHRQLEAELPSLSREASPEAITAHQRALADKIRAARANARPGDILVEPARRQIRGLLAAQLSGKRGAENRAAILEDRPAVVPRLEMNAAYPTDVPVSTVPPKVLLSLPRLPDELEYRFIGRDLILRDTHADLIVDLMRAAIP